MKKTSFLVAVFVVSGALVYAQSAGKTMYIAVKQTAVRSSTGFFADTVRLLALGDQVTVIRESGRWSEIRTAQASGWVYTVALSSRRVTGSGYAASATEIALAGKGFSVEIEAEYRAGGLDYSVVDSLENIRVPAGDLRAFVNAGRLSRGD